MDDYLPTHYSNNLPSVPKPEMPRGGGIVSNFMRKRRAKWIMECMEMTNSTHMLQSEMMNRQLTDQIRMANYPLEVAENKAKLLFHEERREYIRQICQLKIEKEQAEKDGANLKNRLTMQDIERGRLEIENIKKEIKDGLNETEDRGDNRDVINLY